MPSKKNDQIAEQLFGATQTIIDAAIKNLAYDKTVKAKVIGTEKAGSGRYICQLEELKFEAIGGINEYSVGETVQVNVPQNNWDLQKNIIGRYISQYSNTTYVSPFENFFCPDVDPFQTTNSVVGVIANNKLVIKKYSKSISAIAAQKSHDYTTTFFSGNINFTNAYQKESYTALGLKVKFQTNLSNWNLLSGNYGIKISFYKTESDATNDKKSIGELRFDSSELIGAIYNFSSQVEFDWVFDIDPSMAGSASYIRVALYESENFQCSVGDDDIDPTYTVTDFVYNNGVGKPVANAGHSNSNIRATDVRLYLGYNTKDLKDRDYKLSLANNSGFNYWAGWTGEDAKKNIKAFNYTYLYKDENGKWHRSTNTLSQMLKNNDGSNYNWEALCDMGVGIKYAICDPPYVYQITGDELTTTGTTIRFKARFYITEDDYVDSNILTFYKYNDGSVHCYSGESAKKDEDEEDKKKEEEKATEEKYIDMVPGVDFKIDNDHLYWCNGFSYYYANDPSMNLIHGDDVQLYFWPKISYYHPENSNYTDIRITLANGPSDIWRLGSPFLYWDIDPLGSNAPVFKFAHNSALFDSQDYLHSIIIGISFTNAGKVKLLGGGKYSWANSYTITKTDIPLMWKGYWYEDFGTSAQTGGHSDEGLSRSSSENIPGSFGVSCRVEKLKISKPIPPNWGTGFISQKTNDDMLVINAHDIFDGHNKQYNSNYINHMFYDSNTRSIKSSNIEHPNGLQLQSSYLECNLECRLIIR